jgi:putative MATE family efflux protein
MAVTAMVSRRVGAKEPKRAADAAFQAILIALALGITLGVVGFWFAEDVLALMGGEPELIAEGVAYAQIMYAGNLSILLIFLINAIFRGAGDAAIAMRALWLANGINIVLDPMLIFGWGPFPEMGVAGAAIATTTGRSIGVIYQCWHLFNASSVIKLGIENMVIRWKTIRELISISAGGVGQFLIESASWIFLVRVVSLFGSEALAGYTIAFRIIVFTLLPSWGMANAAATLVGQNLGAKQPDRAETSVWRAAKYNTYFLLSLSVIFFLLADPILNLFSPEPQVQAVGVSALKIICVGYIFFSYGMVIGQAFNGAGDTRTPMWISLVVFWMIQIPLSYYLAVPLGWNTEGIFVCIAFAHSLYAIAAIWFFKRGKWKLKEV